MNYILKHLIILTQFPLLSFAQTPDITGKWYTEFEQTDAFKKSKVTLVRTPTKKQTGSIKSDFMEIYTFNLDGTFSQYSEGLFTASLGAGEWKLVGGDQLVLTYSGASTTIKRDYGLEIISVEKLELIEK